MILETVPKIEICIKTNHTILAIQETHITSTATILMILGHTITRYQIIEKAKVPINTQFIQTIMGFWGFGVLGFWGWFA